MYYNFFVKKVSLIIFTATILSYGFKKNDSLSYSTQNKKINYTDTIPIGPNSWVVDNILQDKHIIKKEGIRNWESASDKIRIYFKTSASGKFKVGLNAYNKIGTSKIKVTVNNVSKELNISNSMYQNLNVGMFNIDNPGYNYIELQGIDKTGTSFGDINTLLLGGEAIKSIIFVPKTNFYFGRRGPSVHLRYKTPTDDDILWFYNEITVPKNQDVIGSFFMANGHSQGYFGMQVNSASERRILFSIWSPFKTDNPSLTPTDFRVKNLGNGNDVTVQDFGNEGTGKQSFKVYDWKTETKYKFLLKAKPAVNQSTDYTAYFYNPEVNKWELIACLRRPKTTTYLTGLHSFLENFVPSTGIISREVNFNNQWIYTTDNVWKKINEVKLTVDNTAKRNERKDFLGGINDNGFFLKNCGFFNANVKPNTSFIRTSNPPLIDFSALDTP